MSLPTKEGYLYKFKSFPKKWQYRYFKLNKTYLQFYETQHTLHPKANIVRTDIAAVEPCSTFPERMYVFTISSKSNEKWHVSATNEAEMKDWMQVLQSHLPPAPASAAAAAAAKPSKEKLLQRTDDDPPSPTVSAPPLPGYMSAQFASPPTYEDACSAPMKKPSKPPA